jgi:hypothetical protein
MVVTFENSVRLTLAYVPVIKSLTGVCVCVCVCVCVRVCSCDEIKKNEKNRRYQIFHMCVCARARE